MKYATTLAVFSILATFCFLMSLTMTAESLAQNETATIGNQSSMAVNDTALENQTGSGNISGIIHRFA